MLKTLILILAAALASPAAALDLGGLGDAAGKMAMDKLTKELKASQNKYGPIVFVTGKADLNAKKCERTLKAIDGIIKKYPGFKVQIEGHTDNKGKKESNLELSQKRAEAV